MSAQTKCILCAGADEDERFDYCRACGRTRAYPVEYGAGSPSEASASPLAQDEPKNSVSDHPDLAELLSEVRIISGDAGNGLDGSERDALADLADAAESLLLRVETAERERVEMTDRWARAGHTASERSNQLQHALNKNREAEATITRLQADLARAVEALGPFAEIAPLFAMLLDAEPVTIGPKAFLALSIDLPAADFRRASEVFTSLSEKGE